jgi:two-component system sensor histidine kinase SenX3
VAFVLGLLVGAVVAVAGSAAAALVYRRRELARIAAVDQRHTAEVARGEAEADRLRAALDGLPIGVVLADDRGRVVLRNRFAESVAAARHADVLVGEAVELHLRAAVAGAPGRQVLELYGPPRQVVLVQAVPLSGGHEGAIATITDVTERHRLDVVRTDFVANISHELKTPVGAVIVLAEALADADEPDVVHRLSAKMVNEAERLARTIDDLLELSQIELGGAAVHDVVSVGRVLEEAAERVRHQAQRRHVTLDVREPPARLNALGDRRQLVSAVANLLDNAIKYSEPGSSVVVDATTDGRTVTMSVTDQGIGIPPQHLDRIFERFYRVDKARSRVTGGTGLGLAIVRHVATNHGGTVSVESQEGRGSTFRLQIPAGPGPVAVSAPDDRREAG